jgi:aldehyde:ferredoxin oxidoreductase
MDCYENGIIKKVDADGIELLWGNGDIILELIKKISFREGIGDILGD